MGTFAGILMLVMLFGGSFVVMGRNEGWLEVTIIYSGAAGFVGWIMLACWLIWG